jgi:hypothetical protein
MVLYRPSPGTCIQAHPHQMHKCGPIFMSDLKNMATTRHMHVVPIFM